MVDLRKRTRAAGKQTARKASAAVARGRRRGAESEATAAEPARQDDYQLFRLALHELRSPLTSVQLNGQLLERALAKPGLEKERRLATMIVSSARKLDSLTQDLADVARLRAGQLAVDARTHDVSRLLPEILSRLQGTLDPSRVRVAIPPGLPPIQADARRLERILGNLLAIALRHEAGQAGIELQVSATGGEIVFAVTVLACSDVPKLPPAEPSESALGLGLVVARIMVEGHGGKLETRQELAGHLVLSFSLPTSACA
jgi:K+-sensing histidine kinase KdpD